MEFLVLRLEDVLVVLYFKQLVFGGLDELGLVGDRFFQAINHTPDVPSRDASAAVYGARDLGN
ncbi:MAG: hypothetical protein L0K41_10605 [Yaniella sp.]|nr:hypothetical protein [Yaniella sp.]